MAKKATKKYLLKDQVILNEIYTKVQEVLPKNKMALKKCIERFVHDKHDALYDYAPIDRIYWKKAEVDDFFKSVNIPQEYITAILPSLYYWDMDELQACKDEFSLTCLMCVRYLLKDKSADPTFRELVAIYLAFSGKFYASCHYDLWKQYTPKREVMDYVVNYMLSNKFDLIRTKSVWGAMKSLVNTWIETYKDEFVADITDERIVYIIHQLHNRIHAFLKNIANNYYEAYEKKLYLNKESDIYDEENYRIANNNSTAISALTENTMTYIANTKVNFSICQMVSSSGVDPLDVKGILETVFSDRKRFEELRFVINILLVDYHARYPETEELTGPRFIAHSIAPKPNTKDPDLVRLKNIILEWLNTSERFRKIKTPATRNNYNKAILGYIAITTNNCDKGKV